MNIKYDKWNWAWVREWPSGQEHRQIIDSRVKAGASAAARKAGRKIRMKKLDGLNMEIWFED